MVIRRYKSQKDIQHNGQKKKTNKKQTIFYTVLHSKLKIEQHEPYLKTGVNAGDPEELAFPASHATLVM